MIRRVGPNDGGTEPMCDPEWLAAYLEDGLDGDERTRFEEHALTCETCRSALALCARELVAADAGPTLSTGPPGPVVAPARITDWRPLAAAAVALMALAVGIGGLRPSPQPTEIVRDEQPGTGRTVAGKTFVLERGIWTDTVLRPEMLVDVETVPKDDPLWSELEQRWPELGRWAGIGRRVRVELDGAAYELVR